MRYLFVSIHIAIFLEPNCGSKENKSEYINSHIKYAIYMQVFICRFGYVHKQ